MKKIKAIVYGAGAMGRLMVKLMVEKGVNIVGAIDVEPDIIGKDLGEVVGLGYPLNVKINDNADAVLSEQEADIAVVAVFTTMERMYPYFKKCVENGLNVISTSEEALYPWSTSPELASKLDRLAKKHGVTITGGGYQDTMWVNLIALLSGGSHTIESITGTVKDNLDVYGPEVIEYFHVGKTTDEYYRKVKEGTVEVGGMFRWNLEALATSLGLTIKKVETRMEPLTEDADIESEILGKTISRGLIIGLAEIVDIHTEQGIMFHGEMRGKLFTSDEKAKGDTSTWVIRGIPDIYLESEQVDVRMMTCTQMVNRIPDVINSEPGFITVEKLPMMKYRAFPLEFYLHK